MLSVSISTRAPARPNGVSPNFRLAAVSTDDYKCLGKTNINASVVGLGTLAWGDRDQGFGTRFGEEDVLAMYQEAVKLGINLFDTAEVYGYQSMKEGLASENLLGRCIQQCSTSSSEAGRPVVGTKYFTIPWTNLLVGGGIRIGRQAISDALDASLARLGTQQVDLFSIHFPFPSYPEKILMEGLKDAVGSGRARAVGVCNYNAQQLRSAHAILDAAGIPLATNQVEYSLLKRGAETDGTAAACKELGVSLVAHSPLKQGLLTQFALDREDAAALKIRPLLLLLKFIGSLGGGRTVEQVALNYLICKGAFVIPGAKSVGQVQRNAGAMGWRLDDNAVEIINEKLVSMGM